MAPEVISGHTYDKKCDLWSSGVILHALLCGYLPFYSNNDEDLKTLILQGKIEFDEKEWSKISPEAKDLIRKLLTKNEKQRLSAEEALKHPWFSIIYT